MEGLWGLQPSASQKIWVQRINSQMAGRIVSQARGATYDMYYQTAASPNCRACLNQNGLSQNGLSQNVY